MDNNFNIDPQISLKQITKIEEDTVTGIMNVLSNEEVFKYLPFTSSPNKDEVKLFLGNIINNKTKVWIIYFNEEIVGIIDLINIEEKSANLAYFLAKPYWNKGIISKSINSIIKYAFEDLKLQNIIAPVVSRNQGSIRVLEKNDFSFLKKSEAKVSFDGNIDEVLLYSIIN